MKNLNYVAGEITKGKNLPENLAKYCTGMCSAYNSLGYIKMSMNYFTALDIADEHKDDAKLSAMVDRVNTLVEHFIEDDNSDSLTAFTEFNNLREDIIEIMEIITAYVDRLRIYEHVLNRVEHRFTAESPDLEYYNSYMTNDIMHYILSDKDNVVINSKISELIGQLPVRMLTDSFYEHIRDAFSLYHGAQKGSIDDFYYALSTAAMLSSEAGFDRFPDVYELYTALAGKNYKGVDESEYRRLRSALDIAVGKMTDYADMYVLLVQIVNDALTVILTRNAALADVEEVSAACGIISKTRMCYSGGNGFAEVAEMFTSFEGKQERIMACVSSADYAVEYSLDNYTQKLDELGLISNYNSLARTLKLQSGSDFVKLEGLAGEDIIPDDSYADETAEKLVGELSDSFKGMDVMVKRAVMAQVLSSLPTFFNNTEEIQNYINNSLIQCTDEAEQKAVIELVRKIIKEI